MTSDEEHVDETRDPLAAMPWMLGGVGSAFGIAVVVAFLQYEPAVAVAWVGTIAAMTSAVFSGGVLLGYLVLVDVQRQRDRFQLVAKVVRNREGTLRRVYTRGVSVLVEIKNTGLRRTAIDHATVKIKDGSERIFHVDALQHLFDGEVVQQGNRIPLRPDFIVEGGEKRTFEFTFDMPHDIPVQHVPTVTIHLKVIPVLEGKSAVVQVPELGQP